MGRLGSRPTRETGVCDLQVGREVSRTGTQLEQDGVRELQRTLPPPGADSGQMFTDVRVAAEVSVSVRDAAADAHASVAS